MSNYTDSLRLHRPATHRPLSIAMSSLYLPSDSKIGVGYAVHRLSNMLTSFGHQVTVFSPCVKPSAANYDHVHIPLSGRYRTFRWGYELRNLDLSQYDIHHSHGDNHLRPVHTAPPEVRTLHGSCLSEAIHIRGTKERLRMVALGMADVIGSVRSDLCVAVSDNTKRLLPWVTEVIPCGVDMNTFHPGAKEERPTILFVGTYRQRKRGALLLDVFRTQILPAVPDAQLWMVCEDAPPSTNVDVLGTLAEDDLADRYRRAWAFCLPSTYEGFGIPYIEAMASGTPAIATPNPGAREVLLDGKFGIVTTPESLGNSLLEVLADPLLRLRMAEGGITRARHFDQIDIACRYESLYWRLLKSNKRRPPKTNAHRVLKSHNSTVRPTQRP